MRNYFENPDAGAGRIVNHSVDEDGNEVIEMRLDSGLNDDEDVEDEYDVEQDEEDHPFGEEEDEDDQASDMDYDDEDDDDGDEVKEDKRP